MTGPGQPQDEDRAIQRLLAGRAGLSRPEHDAIAAAVLHATATEIVSEPAPPRRWWLGGALGAAAAAALLAAVLAPRNPAPPEQDAFVARGGQEGPLLQLVCEPSCRAGGHVVLEVARTRGTGYVAVFSFREDGVVIWYAPSDAETTSAPLPAGGAGLLPFQIELDAAHPPGRYEVNAVFSSTPLSRDAVRAEFEHPTGAAPIVRRVFEVVE